MFDLPPQSKTDDFEPTFRSLFSYFVRRGRDAFSIPFEHYRKQKEWDKQVNNAFLLNLSWEYPSKLQKLKDQEKIISQLRTAIRTGTFPDLLGTIGELESQKVRLEELISRRAEELRSFRVHPQYQEFQDQANSLQSEIRALNQENATDRAMLSFYHESLVQDSHLIPRNLSECIRKQAYLGPIRYSDDLTKSKRSIRKSLQTDEPSSDRNFPPNSKGLAA